MVNQILKYISKKIDIINVLEYPILNYYNILIIIMFLRRIVPTRNIQNIKLFKSNTAYVILSNNLRNIFARKEPEKVTYNDLEIRQLFHNLEFLDSFYVSYYNPKTNKHASSGYNVNLKFKKNGMYIDKCLSGNDLNTIMDEIKMFIQNEIKI